MSTISFLAALPALLAITGYVIYRLTGPQKKAQEITKDIVAKLRQNSPERAERLAGLSPSDMTKVLKRDQDLRSQVNKYDFELLKKVTHQEFVKSLAVYVLVTILFLIGVVAFVYVQTQPKATEINKWHLESQTPKAEGLAVDLDNLKLTWNSAGPSADMTIFLENIDTNRRSESFVVGSSQQELIIPKGNYDDILYNRNRGSINRVRAVARTNEDTFKSKEFSLYVGIQVLAIPVEEDSAIWVTALIDNSSIINYRFDATVLVWTKGSSPKLLSYRGEKKNPKTEIRIDEYDSIRWETLDIAYFGPDDLRVVRTEVDA